MPVLSATIDSRAVDAGLVADARTGDHVAFDQLVRRYERRTAAVAYRLLGNTHDALEVSQEAFVRAFRSLHKLDDPQRFAPWLFRIVTNLALNYRRARGPRRNIEGTPLPESREVAAPDGLPPVALATSELAQRIRGELARLSDRQRAALLLSSVDQIPQRRVAQLLGCSVEAVKWHVFEARRKLRIQLADCLECSV